MAKQLVKTFHWIEKNESSLPWDNIGSNASDNTMVFMDVLLKIHTFMQIFVAKVSDECTHL